MTILVEPIYGWGWMLDGRPSPDVPAPFRFAVFEDSGHDLSGEVVDPGHAFHGLLCRLTARHTPVDGQFNVRLRSLTSSVDVAAGYAQVTTTTPK